MWSTAATRPSGFQVEEGVWLLSAGGGAPTFRTSSEVVVEVHLRVKADRVKMSASERASKQARLVTVGRFEAL